VSSLICGDDIRKEEGGGSNTLIELTFGSQHRDLLITTAAATTNTQSSLIFFISYIIKMAPFFLFKIFDWADWLFYSGELTKGGVVFSSDDDNWRRRKKPRLDSIPGYKLMIIQYPGTFFWPTGQLNWQIFSWSWWRSMDWRISIRGI
jgi:hypothetical protein